MGCLPLIVLWLVGIGLGYLLSGPAGALWGAGAGLLAGLLVAAEFARRMRGRWSR
jgi:hypothetical protein